MRFCLAFGFLASITRCCCPPVAVPSLWQDGVNFPSKLALRIKKSVDDGQYLEECTFVDSWQREPGFINVLAFLDASWEYSHRQAAMLKMLQDRLINSGIKEVRFFVINSAEAEAGANNLDPEDEKEAWSTAESSREHTLTEIEQTREALKEKIDPDIGFIQDTEELKVWQNLAASRDQVLVIDKCGRLTYRVIVPWSILHFPYVKAAILSTYKEKPCGECGANHWGIESTTQTMTTTTTTGAYEAESQTEQFPDSLPEDFNIDQLKKIAVKKYKLDDVDSTVTKTFHSKEPQEIPEDIIKLINGSASIRRNSTQEDIQYSTEHRALLLTGDPDINREFSVGLTSDEESIDPTENEEENNSSDNRESISTTAETLSIVPNEHGDQQNGANLESRIVNESNVTSKPLTVYSVAGKERENLDEHYVRSDKDRIKQKKNYSATADPRNSEMHQDSLSVEVNRSGGQDCANQRYCSLSSAADSGSSESVNGSQIGNNIDRMMEEYGSGEEHSENADYVIPIRIIMHAPHIHQYEEPRRKHEYLVLKLGDPDYHGHLEPKTEQFYNGNTRNDTNNENYDDDDDGYEDKNRSEIDNDNDNGEKYSHYRHRHRHHKNGHNGGKDERKDAVYDKDESPGFYGEDAEYWRNFGNVEYQEKIEIQHTGKKIDNEKENAEEIEGSHGAVTIMDDSITQETTPTDQDSLITGAPAEISDKISNEDLIQEEEITNRLIEHYSKLIPWLDYVFED